MLFYIYTHTTPCGSLFYIGKGKERRAWSFAGRNRYWHRIVNKHGGYVITFLRFFENEEAALSFEQNLIAEARQRGERLANVTNGGEGMSGYSHTLEARLAIGRAAKGNKYSVGRKMPEEEKLRRSLAARGIPRPPEVGLKVSASKKGKPNGRLGYKHRPETIEKIKATRWKHTPEQIEKMRTAWVIRKAKMLEEHPWTSLHSPTG